MGLKPRGQMSLVGPFSLNSGNGFLSPPDGGLASASGDYFQRWQRCFGARSGSRNNADGSVLMVRKHFVSSDNNAVDEEFQHVIGHSLNSHVEMLVDDLVSRRWEFVFSRAFGCKKLLAKESKISRRAFLVGRVFFHIAVDERHKSFDGCRRFVGRRFRVSNYLWVHFPSVFLVSGEGPAQD